MPRRQLMTITWSQKNAASLLCALTLKLNARAQCRVYIYLPHASANLSLFSLLSFPSVVFTRYFRGAFDLSLALVSAGGRAARAACDKLK